MLKHNAEIVKTFITGLLSDSAFGLGIVRSMTTATASTERPRAT